MENIAPNSLKWSCVLYVIPIYNIVILYNDKWYSDGLALDLVSTKDKNIFFIYIIENTSQSNGGCRKFE